MTKILVCGSRSKKLDEEFIFKTLCEEITMDDTVIEGCCEGSPDKIAEQVAMKKWAKLEHHPASAGMRLKRNIKMLEKCDRVVALWDFWSYGTSFLISRAVAMGKPVKIIKIGDKQ
ncbi:nucleoside 2-deoxyribosyltransferase [Candidatus Bathyarchaeota archaeon]|nr:nucleoside 2-deoxyribosyltransferase [Candidatus Bathyarchaeota archaeon]